MRIEDTLYPNELENKVIFLSASLPQPNRNEKYFKTANPLEITDAVIAVARAVFSRKGKIVFGGHPTISPLILSVGNEFLRFFEEDYLPFVYIYQPNFLKLEVSKYTKELAKEGIGEIRWVESVNDDSERSLSIMRERMLSEMKPIAAIFIGGMDGIEEEFDMFVKMYPKNPVYPIGSVGGASKILLEEKIIQPMKRRKWSFKWEYSSSEIPNEFNTLKIYPSLANRILSDLRRNHKNKKLWR